MAAEPPRATLHQLTNAGQSYTLALGQVRTTNMPTYYYACTTCKANASVNIPIDKTPKTPKCLTCSKDMQRQYGVSAVTFVGKGWGKDR